MSVEIKIPTINGITLNTKNKYVKDDIAVTIGIPHYDGTSTDDITPDLDKLIERTLTEIINTRITTLGSYAIYGGNITKIEVPNVTTVAAYGIVSTKITKLYLPKAKSIGSNGVYQNFNCLEMRFDSVNDLSSGAIRGSVKLVKLIISNTDKVCNVQASNAFAECYHLSGTVHATYNPEGLRDGLIYVPDELVEDYKVATNWSAFADIIRPLSEYVEEE